MISGGKFKCICDKEYHLSQKALLKTVEIREMDLAPRLKRFSDIIDLPVFFSRIQNRSDEKVTGWLQLQFEHKDYVTFYKAIDWSRPDNNKSIIKEFNSIVDRYLEDIKNSAEQIVGVGEYIFLRSFVEFEGETVGMIVIGPLMKYEHSQRRDEFFLPWYHKGDISFHKDGLSPKYINHLIGNINKQSKHLQEVFWRRIGDTLIPHCNKLQLDIMKAGDTPETFPKNREEIKQRFTNQCLDILSLLRQCLLVEGISLFVWDEYKQSYISEVQAGPCTGKESWIKHDLSEKSLVRSAHLAKRGVAIWPSGKESKEIEIHEKAFIDFNEEHPKHPLHQGAAIKLESIDPVLTAIIALYNPVNFCGEAIENSSFKNSLEIVQGEELPPVGRSRFEYLLFLEIRRLLEIVVRERRTAMFRLFVREAQEKIDKKKDFIKSTAKLFLNHMVELSQASNAAITFEIRENPIVTGPRSEYTFWKQMLKRSVLEKMLESEDVVILGREDLKKVPIENREKLITDLKKEDIGWLAIFELKGPTGKPISLMGLTWTNTLKRTREHLERIKVNLRGLLLQGGALFEILIGRQISSSRHQLWEKTLKTFYQEISKTQIPSDWDAQTSLVQNICRSIEELTGRECAYYLVEDWRKHLYPPVGPNLADSIQFRRMAGPDYLPETFNLIKKRYDNLRLYFEEDNKTQHSQHWFNLSIPKWGENNVTYIGKVIKQYRGILILKGVDKLQEEDRHLVELLVLLIGRSHLLVRLHTEIHHAMKLRQKNFHQNQPDELANQILDYMSQKKGAWPGFQRAVVMLKVPWRSAPICLSRYPVPPDKEGLSEVDMELITEIAGPSGHTQPNHRSVLIRSDENGRKEVQRLRRILYIAKNTNIKSEGYLLLIPLVGKNESLGWVLVEMEQEPPFQVARLSEVLAREWALYIMYALKHEERILSVSMMHHGLRRQLEGAEYPIREMEAFVGEQNNPFSNKMKIEIQKLEKIFVDMTRRLDNDTLLLRLMQAPDQSSMEKIVGMDDQTDIAKIIRRLAKEMEETAMASRKVEIRLLFTPYLSANIPGSKDYLYYLLENLLHNAVKYSFESKWIEVKLEKENTTGKWILEIINPGKPFPDSSELLLKPFTRVKNLDPRRPNIPGSGLGLAVVGMICSAMKAEIKIDTRNPRKTSEDYNSSKYIGVTEWVLNSVKIMFPRRHL